MLHAVSADGGIGFCHSALPNLVAPGYHGPLVIALDSNVLIDLQEHGMEMLNNDIKVDEQTYAEELQSLATLLNLWMLRDIRLIVTPRARTDAQRNEPRFEKLIDGLAESLAFQYGNWSYPAPQNWPALDPKGDELDLPAGADRDLVVEAQAVGAHAFLTRDRRVIRQASLTGPSIWICPPSVLADELIHAGVNHVQGGTCGELGCPYSVGVALAPDIGKWGPVLAHFEDE